MPALIASFDMTSQLACAADGNRVQDTSLVDRQRGAELREERWSMGSKDISHFKPMSRHDDRPSPSRFRALSRSSGLGVSCRDLAETCV